MNPWRHHPSIAGFDVPDSALPPAGSWNTALRLGLVGRVRRNSGDPISRLTEWSGGPTPPPIRGTGRIVGSEDTAETVYQWFVTQAKIRLKDVKAHIRSRGSDPSVAELSWRYTALPKTINSWVAGAKERASGLGIRVSELEVPGTKRFDPRTLHIPKGMIYFASGAKNPGEIEGIARAYESNRGIGIGIDISKCKKECIRALNGVSKRGVSLFIDSGAFRELKGRDLELSEWRARFLAYRPIAAKFGARAYVVAPDKIGDQQATAERIEAFGDLMPPRAFVLLAAQGGRVPRHLFWGDMRQLLEEKGVNPNKIVAALPMAAKGFSINEVAEFANYFGEEVDRYHLLGMSPLKKRGWVRGDPHFFSKIVGKIRKASPGAKITCDATTMISGLRGPTWELGVNPRVYTYAQDIVRYDVMLEAFQRSWRGGHTMEGWVEGHGWGEKVIPDYSDSIVDIDSWLPVQHRKVIADRLEDMHRRGLGPKLSKSARDTLLASVEDWLFMPVDPSPPLHHEDPKWVDDMEVESWINDQWVRWLGTYLSARVKRDAIKKAWLVKVNQAIDALAFG